MGESKGKADGSSGRRYGTRRLGSNRRTRRDEKRSLGRQTYGRTTSTRNSWMSLGPSEDTTFFLQ